MTEELVFFRTRFLASVNEKLRKRIIQKGELVELVILSLQSVDLSTIPLLEIRSDLKDLAVTTVKLPIALHATLKRIAATRNSSMNALVNSAVLAYTESTPPKKR